MKFSSKHLRSSVAMLLLSCVLFSAVGCTSDNKSSNEISEEDISGGILRKEFLRLFQALKNASTPSDGGNEADYLAAFLDARIPVMQPEEAHADLSRVDTQRKFLNEKNFTLELPLEWTMYGDEFYLDKEQLDGIAD